MMKSICLVCTALLLIGMVACNPRSSSSDRKSVTLTEQYPVKENMAQNITFTTTRITKNEVMHQLTLKVDTNTYYHMVAITDLQTGTPAKRVPNFNEMEK